MIGSRLFAWTLLATILPLAALAAPDPFDVTVLESEGRSVTAEIVDLNGDGRADLLQVIFQGIPPDQRRRIRAYFQRADGTLPKQPSVDLALPPESAAFDLADVLETPGNEVLLLRPRGVMMLSLASAEGIRREVRIPDGSTVGPAADERGLDRLRMATHALAPEPLLVIPALREIVLLTPEGSVTGRLAVEGRANYLVQPTGPIFAESDIQIFFDPPRISLGDVDGDGRSDVVSSNRHELRVFLQDGEGRFPTQPQRLLKIGAVSLEDHIRGTGSVRSLVADVDADGLLDVVISRTSGGIMAAEARTTIHLNRGGSWDLDEPDAVFRSNAAVSADQLIDLDGDGRLELARFEIPISVLEVVEIFLTRAIDVHLSIYGMNGEGSFDPIPRYRRKLDIPINFETGRARGFVPTLDFDLNGDGRRDFLSSTDGTALEIFLGDEDRGYFRRAVRQDVDTTGTLSVGDWNRDGLPDLVLFDPRQPDHPIRLLRNRGTLPGGPPGTRAAGE